MTASPEDDTLFDEAWSTIRDLLDDDQQLIQRRWLEMESPESIAADLGTSRRTVDRRMRGTLDTVAQRWRVEYADTQP